MIHGLMRVHISRCRSTHEMSWGNAKVPVKVTISGYTWRSTFGNRGGQQYIVVNADARRNAGVRAGDVVTITHEPDNEKREIKAPIPLQKALGAKLTQKLNALSFTHKKEFIVWYSEAKRKTHAPAERRR